MPIPQMIVGGSFVCSDSAGVLDMRNKYPVTLKHLMDNKLLEAEAEAKSVPVHCIVEQAQSFDGRENGHNAEPNVELDTYAILPSATLFSEIVRTALTKLGYSASEIVGAKGCVRIKHWKALTFDSITESADSTVEDILGELTSMATLHIRLCSRMKVNLLDDVKDKLLAFLVDRSQNMLLNLGCPIEKNILKKMSRGESPLHIGADLKDAFEQWYKDNSGKTSPKDSPQEAIALTVNRSQNSTPYRPILPKPEAASDGRSQCSSSYPALRNELNSSLMARARMRTSFDPDLEIPRLQNWFQENQHPSREQLLVYLNELNSLESRRGNKPLDLNNIVYWFKNARAALRRSSSGTRESSSEEARDDTEDKEENLDDRLSPTSTESVPLLPNRNAVYVVADPLHPHNYISRSQSPVVHIMPQSPEDMSMKVDSNENLQDKTKEPDREIQENGFHQDDGKENKEWNLAKLGEKRKWQEDEDEDHYKENVLDEPSDLRIKTEGTDDDYESASSSCHSPMMRLTPGMTLAQSLSTPPPAHQQPLNMTVMSHPINMHYLSTPTQHLYGNMDTNSLLGRQFKELQSSDDRKKRSRVFIDPLSEIPKLEKWFIEDTHPSSYMIEKYTEELNHAEYRQRFPKLEPKNVQLWFKNHRAKVKRARTENPTIVHESPTAVHSGQPPAIRSSPMLNA